METDADLIKAYRFNSTAVNLLALLAGRGRDDPRVLLAKAVAGQAVNDVGVEKSARAINYVIECLQAQAAVADSPSTATSKAKRARAPKASKAGASNHARDMDPQTIWHVLMATDEAYSKELPLLRGRGSKKRDDKINAAIKELRRRNNPLMPDKGYAPATIKRVFAKLLEESGKPAPNFPAELYKSKTLQRIMESQGHRVA
jgi:hypothetical protein